MIIIKDKSDCCGCSACANVCNRKAITMQPDSMGFLYPCIDNSICTDCGLCETVCPVLQKRKELSKVSNIKVYAAKNKNKTIQHESSSGGIFTIFSDYMIEHGGYVYGAVYDEVWNIVHRCASTKEEAKAMQGSKYVQSNLGDTFAKIRVKLNAAQSVLFVGTPCQVQGLNLFLCKEYKNLITCDLVCHCVASPKIFKDYISLVEFTYNKRVVRINMKDKTKGWGHQAPRIYFSDGSSIFGDVESHLWNLIYGSHLCARPSCFVCPFTNYRRPGDITIGDFWGLEKTMTDFIDSGGVSLIMLNNQKGNDLFTAVNKRMIIRNCRIEDSIQPQLLGPVSLNNRSHLFEKERTFKSFVQLCRDYWGVSIKQIVLICVQILKHKYHESKNANQTK